MPCLGIGDDGVLLWNAVHQGEVAEDGEIAEAVAECVVERVRLLTS